MSAGKIIGYIIAGILILFGVIFILGAFGSEPHPEYILVGIILALIGFGIIWFVGRKSTLEDQEVKVQIDLTGDIDLDTLTCKSCGGQLSSEHTSLEEGALVVDCPFCGTHYQIVEQPKW